MSRDRRKSVVETNHPRLGVVRQCRLLGLCRSTFYYKTAGETPKNLALLRVRRPSRRQIRTNPMRRMPAKDFIAFSNDIQ